MPAVGPREIVQGDRLYQPIQTLMMSMKAVVYALAVLKKIAPPEHPDDDFSAFSDVSGRCIALPAFGPLGGEVFGIPPPERFGINIKLHTAGRPVGADYTELPGLIPFLIPGIYALHFQSCHDWMNANGHSNTTHWPMALDFGRAVRNAISHGGRIIFSSPNYRQVSWHGLTYGPQDNGKSILNVDLFFPDLLALMVRNDDEIVALGAPR